MPTFLSDPAPVFYAVLFAFVGITGAIAARNQGRKSLLRFGAALAVLALLYGIDRLFESPREDANRKISEMVNAVDTRNPDAFVQNIADVVGYRGGSQPVLVKRDEIRHSHFWVMIRQLDVHVTKPAFSRDQVKQIDPDTIEVGFSVAGIAQERRFPVYIRATFKKQSDGQLRLTAIASYNHINRNELLQIPNFPK
jgi:hypothetical protein